MPPSFKFLFFIGFIGASLHPNVAYSPFHVKLTKINNKQAFRLHSEVTPSVGGSYTSPTTKKVTIGSVPEFAIEGDSTEETGLQRAVVGLHFVIATINLVMAASLLQFDTAFDYAILMATIFFSIVIGDFATGVFHWSVDNYGSLKTPIFGTVCAAFQGHHVTPWTITFRSFANNVYKICYGTIPALLLLTFSSADPLLRIFFTIFISGWMISQEFHKFAHMRSTPKSVKILQDMGLILSKKEHGLHHTSPFEGHYCILTGICNPILDKTNFFRYLEVIVYKLTGG